MRIAICDDSSDWQKILKSSIDRWAAERNTPISYVFFDKVSTLYGHLSGDLEIDVLFLDIEFPDKESGMDIAKKIRSSGNDVPLIFVTGHMSMAAESYFVDAVGFLVKPFSYDQLAFFMDKITTEKKPTPTLVLKIESSQGLIYVRYMDIVYAESKAHNVIIHTEDGSYETRLTLKELLNELGDKEFMQIHRSYVVSMRCVSGLKARQPYEIELTLHQKRVHISIGRTFIDSVKMAYANFAGRSRL